MTENNSQRTSKRRKTHEKKYRKPLEPLNLTYTQYIVMMVLWAFGSSE